MADNQGIFNRNETIMRAQQDHDLYAFIANKPQGRHQGLEPAAVLKDELIRIALAEEPVIRGQGAVLLKNVIKAAAFVPMVIVYVGPHKIAYFLAPLIKKMASSVSYLLQKFTLLAQKQLQRALPYLNGAKEAMSKVLEKMKTTLDQLLKGLNQEFFSEYRDAHFKVSASFR